MPSPLHLTLELELAHEPIEGRLSHPGGEPRRFVGYVELIGALEELRTQAPPPAGPTTHKAER